MPDVRERWKKRSSIHYIAALTNLEFVRDRWWRCAITFSVVFWNDIWGCSMGCWHFRKKWCLPKTFLAPTHGPVISKLLYWVITGFPTCVRQKKDRPPNSNAEHSFLKMQNAKPRNWQLAEHFRSHTSLEPLNGWKWMRYTLNILYGWFSDIECIGTHFIFNDIALFAVVS
jgi:hypothetical protein